MTRHPMTQFVKMDTMEMKLIQESLGGINLDELTDVNYPVNAYNFDAADDEYLNVPIDEIVVRNKNVWIS